MDFDLSSLLGNSGGLLSQDNQRGVDKQTLLGAAAGLLQASGPSPYKGSMRIGEALGSGIQGALASRKSAFDDILKQQLVHAQTLDKGLPLMQMAQKYQAEGMPVPPELQAMLRAVTGMSGLPSPGGAPSGGIGAGVPGAMAQAPQALGLQGQAPQPAPQGTPDLYSRTRAQMGINPMRSWPGMPGSEDVNKAIAERIHATDPALSANERQKKIMEGDVEHSGKLYPALVSLGTQGAQAKEDASLSSALANDKDFYSGLGQGVSEAWKKLQVALGGDPNAAFSQEAFRKITAANINTQIGEMKATAAEMGGAAGRIFQNQTLLMEKASQGLGISPAANKFLANLQTRAADQNITIGDMAIKYKKEHGILDAGFDEQMSAHIKAHPLFSKAELADARKLTGVEGPAPAAGPPQVPGSPAPTPAWVPPGAKQAPDGNFYMQQNGKWYRVNQ